MEKNLYRLIGTNIIINILNIDHIDEYELVLSSGKVYYIDNDDITNICNLFVINNENIICR